MPFLKGPHESRRRVDPACAARRFEKLSIWTVRAAGGLWGFRLAVLMILGWATAGAYFRYHESWATTFGVVLSSVTFLLVFLIQNVQNRELKAVHLKLDELIYPPRTRGTS